MKMWQRILEKIIRAILDPSLAVRFLWKKIPVGSFGLRSKFDATERPPYAFGVYYAAKLARALGIGRISVIEFGVGSGGAFIDGKNGPRSFSRVGCRD